MPESLLDRLEKVPEDALGRGVRGAEEVNPAACICASVKEVAGWSGGGTLKRLAGSSGTLKVAHRGEPVIGGEICAGGLGSERC